MSKLFCHGQPDSGMFILQHQGFNKREGPGRPAFDLDLRGMISAVRVLGREDTGHWRIDEESAGDVIGGALWKPSAAQGAADAAAAAALSAASSIAGAFGGGGFGSAPSTGRSIPAWSFAWPVVAVRGSGNTDVATGVAGQCKISPDPMFLPLYDGGVPDIRFEKKKLNIPKDWGDIKFPENYVGISLMSTREDEQVDFFFPSDPRLIAVHHNGDVRMGTIVTDMAPDFKVDKERNARLQSIFRVIKNPLGEPANTIALNMTRSGCGDVFGGMFFDFSANPDKAGVIGTWNSAAGGPIVAGHPNKDKHIIGTDADGTVINQGHLWLRSKFYWNEIEDGPLKYDGIYEEPSREFPKPKVEIQQTPYQAGSYFQYDPNMGEFRWSGGTFIYNTSNITTKKAEKAATGSQEETGGDGAGEAVETSVGGLGDRASGYGLTPVATGVQSNDAPPPPPPPSKTTTATAPNIIQERTTGQLIPHMSGTLLRRPQMQGRTGFPDMGKWENQTSEKIEQYDKRTPVTYKTVPFGKQGGDSWDRKQVSPNSRYSGGTGLGGIAVIPPEADITDTYGATCDCFPPTTTASGKPISNSSLLINTGTFIATGQADTSIGGVKLGHRTWGTCNGKQITEAINSAGVSLLAGTGTWEDGALLLRWNGEDCCGTAFCVDHKIIAPDGSAGQEQTMQNRDGYIALQDGPTLASGTIPYVDNGLLDDASAMSYDSSTGNLTVPGGITLGGTFQAANIIGTTSVTSPAIRVGTAATYNTINVSGSGQTATLPAITGTLGVITPASSVGAVFYAGSTNGKLDNDNLNLKYDGTFRVNHNHATSYASKGGIQVIDNIVNEGAIWSLAGLSSTAAPHPSLIAATFGRLVGTSAAQIEFQLSNLNNALAPYGDILVRPKWLTAGAESGAIALRVAERGTFRDVYEADDENNTHIWSLGGSELMRLTPSFLGVGSTTGSYKLEVDSGSANEVAFFGADARVDINFDTDNTPAAAFTMSRWLFSSPNDAGAGKTFFTQQILCDPAAGSEKAQMQYISIDGATTNNLLDLGSDNIILNESGADVDIRIESTGSLYAGVLNSGTDKWGFFNSNPQASIDLIGDARFGDSTTNYVGISSTGDVSFAGSSGFYPRVLSQAAEPAAGTGATQIDSGEMIFWVDTDDSNRVYQMYNNGGTVVKVELT